MYQWPVFNRLYALMSRPRIRVFGVIILLLVALLLRTYRLGEVHTMQTDEFSWMFSGVSLLHTGIPTSWTIKWSFGDFSMYDDTHEEEIDEETYWIVTPWLDHPPLFSLLIAGWMELLPDQDVKAPDWAAVRIPMIAISLATIVCTFLLAERLLGTKKAWVTLVAYVFFPASVLASRFALAENAIGLWFIAGILLTHMFVNEKENSRWVLVSMMLLALTGPLLKLSGAIVPGSIALILLLHKKYRPAFLIVATGIVSGLIFLAYGWSYNWDALLSANAIHNIRAQSFGSAWSLITQATVANMFIFDPTIPIGVGGLLLLIAQKRGNKTELILGPALFVVVSMLLLVAPVEAYSWYKFPSYPLIAIGFGYMLFEFLANKRFMLLAMMPAVLYAVQRGFAIEGSLLKAVAAGGVCISTLLFLNILPQRKQSLLLYAVVSILFVTEFAWVLWIIANYHLSYTP